MSTNNDENELLELMNTLKSFLGMQNDVNATVNNQVDDLHNRVVVLEDMVTKLTAIMVKIKDENVELTKAYNDFMNK